MWAARAGHSRRCRFLREEDRADGEDEATIAQALGIPPTGAPNIGGSIVTGGGNKYDSAYSGKIVA